MINICVPVVKRYDLLQKLLLSLRWSTIKVDTVYVIDNGLDEERLNKACSVASMPIVSYTPKKPMGVAESWNWFVANVQEDRVITNDDVEFAVKSLETMTKSKASFVSCSFGFSCFIIRDACIREVGMFDENISPGYAYFEDMDYLRRMRLAGIVDEVVICGVTHSQSATYSSLSPRELEAHHEKFKRAQDNYTNKWSNEPSWDQLKAIGGNGSHK